MKPILQKCIAAILSLGMSLYSLPLSVFAESSPNTPASARSSFSSSSGVKGVFVRTCQAADLSSGTVASVESMKAELDTLVSSAVEAGLNTIFFEAKPSAQLLYTSEILPSVSLYENYSQLGGFDSLAYLTEQASSQNLSVYAILDPYRLADLENTSVVLSNSHYRKQPERFLNGSDGTLYYNPSFPETRETIAQIGVELLRNYPIAGLVLENPFPQEVIAQQKTENFAAEILSLIKGGALLAGKESLELGLLLPYSPQDPTFSTHCQLAKNLQALGATDFLAVAPDDFQLENYSAMLEEIRSSVGEKTTVATLNAPYSTKNRESTALLGEGREFAYQLLLNSNQNIPHFVVYPYNTLGKNLQVVAKDSHSDYGVLLRTIEKADLTFPQTLAVHRPEGKLRTTYSTYFIMGTSDPTQELTMDGVEVPRYGTKGAFGILVTLENGVNTFTFAQGEETVSVVIEKSAGTGAQPLTAISQNSIYPAYSDFLFSDSALPVRCTAPSGAKITASIAGNTVTLVQEDPSISAGMAASFSGKLPLSTEYGHVQNIGPVSYSMTYQGTVSSYTSNGEIYTAAPGTPVKVRIKDYLSNVLEDYQVPGVFTTALKVGATDYIQPRSDGGAYFELASGGFISKSNVVILEGDPDIDNHISQVTTEPISQGELLRFHGTALPAYHALPTEKGLSVKLFHTTISDPLLSLDTSLIQDVQVQEEEWGIQLDFTLAEPLWGYDISFDGTDTLIFVKTPPKRGSASQPLQGVTLVLDPGHGNYDSGALGIAGTSGATESDLNLIVAQVTRMRLEQLGATVFMTRANDTFLELDERMIFSDQVKPDFFIAIHHNSTAETVDSNKAKGVEIYYHTSYSQKLAENLLHSISKGVNRNLRSAEQGYYRVTRVTHAPAVLAEIGFVPNPAEYEQLCDPAVIIRTADSICQAVLETIPPSQSE